MTIEHRTLLRVEETRSQRATEPRGRTLFILGVSYHANVRDIKNRSEQQDSALLEEEREKCRFGEIYT